jgi:hypothetical protein
VAAGLTWLAILAPAALLATGFLAEAGAAPKHPFILLSANLAMIGWFVGSLALREKWRSAPRWWAIGCAYLWLHVALVYHLMHAWSHDSAFNHIRNAGGMGEGLYMNYAFMGLWLADAIWLNFAESSYWRRPSWIGWFVHGYLFFMVFNAMVPYGTWVGRSVFAGFAIVAIIRFSICSRLPESSSLR